MLSTSSHEFFKLPWALGVGWTDQVISFSQVSQVHHAWGQRLLETRVLRIIQICIQRHDNILCSSINKTMSFQISVSVWHTARIAALSQWWCPSQQQTDIISWQPLFLQNPPKIKKKEVLRMFYIFLQPLQDICDV